MIFGQPRKSMQDVKLVLRASVKSAALRQSGYVGISSILRSSETIEIKIVTVVNP